MLKLSSVQVARRGLPLCEPIHFCLQRGEGIQLIAPNGSGKSTLLKAIAGLYPYLGNIVQNEPYAFLTHQTALIPHFSVEEMLAYWRALYQLTLPDSTIKAHLSVLGLIDHYFKPTEHLSAGQSRQMGLLALLMSGRPLWLLDEPFNALDQKASAWWTECMKKHLADGGALLVVSHQFVSLPSLIPYVLSPLKKEGRSV